jgi:hypothetical protein
MKYSTTIYEVAALVFVGFGLVLFWFDLVLCAVLLFLAASVLLAIDYAVFINKVNKIFKK